MENIIEIWKDIEGYEGLYQVSNLGRVKSLERVINCTLNGKRVIKERILKPGINTWGYCFVVLCKNGFTSKKTIHRLVAMCFLDNTDNLPEVNHKDEDKTNNMVWVNEDGSIDYNKSNLEWCDRIYNKSYSVGKKVLQIHNDKLINIWSTAAEVERKIGIDASSIYKICNKNYRYKSAGGYKWQYVDDYLADWWEQEMERIEF